MGKGRDLFTFKNQIYMVTIDYYSNFIEMDRLRNSSSSTVIKVLKMHFCRHGIPQVLISDSGQQCSSQEFSSFAQQWEFKHVTSSPHYLKSNGKAESAVKTCKNLLKKGDLAKTDVHLSLLDHCNTPTEHTSLSPAQRSFGRRTQALLPLASKLLEPVISTNVRTKLISSRAKQASYYNRLAKPLLDLKAGDVV